MLTVIDEYTRECLAIVVDPRLRSDDMLDCLTDLFVEHGVPDHIRLNCVGRVPNSLPSPERDSPLSQKRDNPPYIHAFVLSHSNRAGQLFHLGCHQARRRMSGYG